MTSDSFAAEFVAYNDFRQALGQAPVTREAFTRTIDSHNAALSARELRDYLNGLDDPAPEA